MEDFDQRRKHRNAESPRNRAAHHGYGGGHDGSEREQRNAADDRYGEPGGTERSTFSPDWSHEGAEPRHSSDPYYSRNRDHQRPSERGRRSGGWQGDQDRTTTPEQRERGFQPRDAGALERGRDDERETHYRGYYDRSVTPYEYPGGRGNLYMESWSISGPYAGRGPKGYKRSDQQIVDEASQLLERDGQIDATDIEVTAEDSVIRLRGTVPDRLTKRRAEDCVESVYGVRDVMNELRVAPPGASPRSSTSEAAQTSDTSQSGAGSSSAGGNKSAKGSTPRT